MEEVLSRLKELLAELPPQLRRGAGRVLDRPREVAVTSMRALAASAGVTPPTMLRLARRLGFANYESFRAVFRAAVTGGGFRGKAASLQRLGEHGGDAGVVARMGLAARDNIDATFEEAGGGDMVRAAELLRHARRIHALGVGAPHWMSCYLQYLGRAALPELCVPPAARNSPVEEMVGVGKGDVVLILSVAPYAVQMLKVAEIARAGGASVIAVTDSRGAPLAALSDVLLVAGTASPQFYPSMVGVVAVIETVIALAVARGEGATLARIAAIDRLRRAEGGYIEA